MNSKTTSRKIKKVLIANRGEIAVRIMETCQLMGIKTVGLYHLEEKELPHSLLGDESVCLGEGSLHDTYLNGDKIVEVALEKGADAIHPGYGFLSENAAFSKKVREAGILFIGPQAETMTLMGDKTESKKAMEKLGVPIIPGYHGDNQEDSFLKEEAQKIGYPLLIKASAGGGGKGMRVVYEDDLFIESLESARREAHNAFGNDKVLIEKYIENPRHIEVQVLSSCHGEHFHLFERECSIQRRHQKIIEESPSPALENDLRLEMCKVAVQITEGIQYEGAGTIEYILDEDGSFYFLEMNTRLQVEHPITEMVTGVDLVKSQIEVAEGRKLSFKQSDLEQKGHAIEARIYAENPDQDFLPSVGDIVTVGSPKGSGVRFDCGYQDGNTVSIKYDPMLAKLICWAEDRDTAISKTKISLKQVLFAGLKTNRQYLQRILDLEDFEKGITFTHFIPKHAEDLEDKGPTNNELALAIAAHFLCPEKGQRTSSQEKVDQVNGSSWDLLSNFRNS
ncbi:MAG: hypothetical protein CME68_12015 [Halobacteriovoraceae bacterium]|nr:hypothetical protein [Halobacteriovoraceae bacterium]